MGYFFLKLIECLEQEGTLFGLHNPFTNMRITCKSSGKVYILYDKISSAMEFITKMGVASAL